MHTFAKPDVDFKVIYCSRVHAEKSTVMSMISSSGEVLN